MTEFKSDDPCPKCSRPIKWDRDGGFFCWFCGWKNPQPDEEPRGQEVEYGLQLSFWIDTDAYTQRDREMFVAGYEFNTIVGCLENILSETSSTIHRENESRVRMAAAKFGRVVEIQACSAEHDPDGTWSFLLIKAKT